MYTRSPTPLRHEPFSPNNTKPHREQQLPWQKDKPKLFYNQLGKWFLTQQQGADAPIQMAALEVGVVILLLLFWWSQRRKMKKKKAQVAAVLAAVDGELDLARQTLDGSRQHYDKEVLRKEEEVREMQSFSSEQSVTIDLLTRQLYPEQ